jgi:DNA-binding NarL/FixJ family response regulator
VLITDIFIPVKEGIETIWSCRAEFPQTRIIAGGAIGKRDSLGAAKLLGADATLRKPFAADQLLDVVRKVLHAPSG